VSEFKTKAEAERYAIAELRREARLSGESCQLSICAGPPCNGEAPSECLLCDKVIVGPDGEIVLDTRRATQ
jgi:hypothetical protein